MPFIEINMLAGRTDEQKRQLLGGVTATADAYAGSGAATGANGGNATGGNGGAGDTGSGGPGFDGGAGGR